MLPRVPPSALDTPYQKQATHQTRFQQQRQAGEGEQHQRQPRRVRPVEGRRVLGVDRGAEGGIAHQARHAEISQNVQRGQQRPGQPRRTEMRERHPAERLPLSPAQHPGGVFQGGILTPQGRPEVQVQVGKGEQAQNGERSGVSTGRRYAQAGQRLDAAPRPACPQRHRHAHVPRDRQRQHAQQREKPPGTQANAGRQVSQRQGQRRAQAQHPQGQQHGISQQLQVADAEHQLTQPRSVGPERPQQQVAERQQHRQHGQQRGQQQRQRQGLGTESGRAGSTGPARRLSPIRCGAVRRDTDSVHFRNIQKDAGCSSNSRNPHWVVLVPLGKIP